MEVTGFNTEQPFFISAPLTADASQLIPGRARGTWEAWETIRTSRGRQYSVGNRQAVSALRTAVLHGWLARFYLMRSLHMSYVWSTGLDKVSVLSSGCLVSPLDLAHPRFLEGLSQRQEENARRQRFCISWDDRNHLLYATSNLNLLQTADQ